jgi:PAS domain S-box-containing protein
MLAWRESERDVARLADRNFNEHVGDIQDAIDHRMTSYQQVLRGGAALFSASDIIERRAWHAYVSTLKVDQFYPGILGVGVAAVFPAEQSAAVIAAIRSEGFPDFTIRPEGQRALYTAIVFLEPFSAVNRRAFGYDMFSEAIRGAAMARARDTGQASMTGKVTLMQEAGAKVQAGMLMYVPVYRNGLPVSSVAERRAALKAYVFSPFRMDDLMAGILGQGRHARWVDLQIYDGSSAVPDALMHRSHQHEVRETQFAHVRTMEVAGHTWTLVMRATPQFMDDIDNSKSTMVLLVGMAMTAFLLAVLWAFQRRREHAMALAAEMTRSLLASEARYSRAVAGSNEGIWDWDVATGQTYCSPRLIALLLYEQEGFPTTISGLHALLHGDDHALAQAAVKEHWKCAAPLRMSLRLMTGEGSYRYYQVKGEAQRDGQGRARSMAGSLSDITERIQAELALRSSEERFRTLVQHAPVGIFLSDIGGQCEFVNGRWCEITGMTPQQARGDGWVLGVHRQDRQGVFDEWRSAIAEGREFSREFRFNNGEHDVWVSTQAARWSTKEGEQTGFIGTTFDLTERMKAELLKNEFISTVSHELRTPLTSIRGALGLVVGGALGALSEPVSKLLTIAANNSERLVRLINDILDIEKLESGQLRFELRRYALQPLIEQAIGANQAFAQQLGVHCVLEGALPDAFAVIDPDRTIQVLTNLLSNAAKFSPQGQVVTVTFERREGQLRVSVRDRGPGIAASFHERIFQKFSQADSSDTRSKGGTGLGLNISKAIVEHQGGSIGFSSEPGQGSTFYFDLPEAPALPAPSVQRGQAVLVCEHDPQLAALISSLLQGAGFDTDMAHDSVQASSLLASKTYLAMTLDLALPSEGGLAFASHLREQPYGRSLPIILLSADIQASTFQAAGLGLIDCLGTPLDQQRLLGVLQHTLQRRDGQRKTILHIEDDEDMAQVLATLLGPSFNLILAGNLAQAKVCLDQGAFDLVILDLGLPDGSGAALLPLIALRTPSVPVIIFSGQDFNGSEALSAVVCKVLLKARSSEEMLLRTIFDLIGPPSPRPPHTVGARDAHADQTS